MTSKEINTGKEGKITVDRLDLSGVKAENQGKPGNPSMAAMIGAQILDNYL